VKTVAMFAVTLALGAALHLGTPDLWAAKPPAPTSHAKLIDGGDRYLSDTNEALNYAPTPTADKALPDSQAVPQDAQEQDRLAQEFLNQRLTVWQQRMELQDWRISIFLTRRDDLKAGTLGGIRWDKDKKVAVMSVLDASDYRMSYDKMLADMQFTLVHELVHLELASLPRSEASRSNEEHAVNRIAQALLTLDRSK
jgi:hypothetical protein